MRLFFAVVVFSFFSFNGVAQIMGDGETYLVMERINPTFQGGGMDKFSTFIDKEFDYSKVTKSGKMIGTFTVDEEGNVKNIKITQFFDIESATEFIRVLKKCPKWEPAKRGGKPISVDINYPMTFRKKESQSSDEGPVYTAENVEYKPEFAGGLSNFYKFIAQNYQSPEQEGLRGKVIVSFVVDVDGSLKNIKVLKDVGYGSGAEAIRVLKMCPKWTPAKQNGIPVRCVYQLPITIKTR